MLVTARAFTRNKRLTNRQTTDRQSIEVVKRTITVKHSATEQVSTWRSFVTLPVTADRSGFLPSELVLPASYGHRNGQ